MRTISDIYTEYKIIPSLQQHMLRVAAVASVICDNFNEPLPKDDIITACLLHDTGNIIKSNLERFPEFLEPEGLEYWQKVKDEYVRKYGPDEHVATIMIAQEINISDDVFNFLQHIGFSNATINDTSKSFENKIGNYADMRVGPHGVLPMEERITEANKRYLGRTHAVSSDNFESLSQSLRNIEKQIFAKCKIKPEDITDEIVAPIIESLKDFVLKYKDEKGFYDTWL